mmetsp:Transcript_134647/g.340290  ORF Transcript_134647/g.340290 Transcript_134647/m.340290 type:complete len:390 (+) Transcript_134647:85-1254(+)
MPLGCHSSCGRGGWQQGNFGKVTVCAIADSHPARTPRSPAPRWSAFVHGLGGCLPALSISGASPRSWAPLAALLASTAALCIGSPTPPCYRARRSRCCGGAVRRCPTALRMQRGQSSDVVAPANLYELLGVSVRVDAGALRKAYLQKQKLLHPDVAGPDGTEISSLLNDAYKLLSDPQRRAAYDKQLKLQAGKSEWRGLDDNSPTWQRSHTAIARRSEPPVFTGTPRSRSLWDRLSPSERGQRHGQQEFLFVNEWNCIACFNCCDIGPQTFCIDSVQGKARVFAQWGNSEEDLDWAVKSCPTDCIHWVSRAELQVLEHVTAQWMFKTGPVSFLPRAMSPFTMATEFRAGQAQAQAEPAAGVGVDRLQSRLQAVFYDLPDILKSAARAKA